MNTSLSVAARHCIEDTWQDLGICAVDHPAAARALERDLIRDLAEELEIAEQNWRTERAGAVIRASLAHPLRPVTDVLTGFTVAELVRLWSLPAEVAA